MASAYLPSVCHPSTTEHTTSITCITYIHFSFVIQCNKHLRIERQLQLRESPQGWNDFEQFIFEPKNFYTKVNMFNDNSCLNVRSEMLYTLQYIQYRVFSTVAAYSKFISPLILYTLKAAGCRHFRKPSIPGVSSRPTPAQRTLIYTLFK